jgi:Fibronectin type III domain/FG-GAP-like repeat
LAPEIEKNRRDLSGMHLAECTTAPMTVCGGFAVMTRFSTILSAILLLSFGSVAGAQSVRLAWDANRESDVVGYTIDFGTASRQYTGHLTVGKVTAWTVPGLTVGQTYYFAVRALNAAGISSAPSTEVSTRVLQSTGLIPGRSELFWRHTTTGGIARWVLDGITQVGGSLVGPGTVADANWQMVGSGDFNGDGETDIVWQHTDGWISVWLLRGTTLLDGRLFQPDRVDPVWRITAVADLDNDGKSDLIWRHRTNGYVSVWFMNGTSMREGQLLEPGQVADLDWVIVGAADFDGDGHGDLLWRHATNGWMSIWFMNGYRQLSGRSLTPNGVSDLNWRVAALTDVSADGRADIIWQHTDGRLSAWVMNGTSLVSGDALNPAQVVDLGWRISTGR